MPRRSRIAKLFAAVTMLGAAAATGTSASADTCTPQVIQLVASVDSVAPQGSQMWTDVRQVQQRDTNQYLETDPQVVQDLLAAIGRYGYHWNCATNQLMSSGASATPASQSAAAPGSPTTAPGASAAAPGSPTTAPGSSATAPGSASSGSPASSGTTDASAASAAPAGSDTSPAATGQPSGRSVALPTTPAGNSTGPLSSVAFDVIVALLVLSVLGVFGAWRFNTSRARRRAT